jgi:NADPH-dependent curcumin reductase
MPQLHSRVVLASRPDGAPRPDHFELETVAVPEPRDGELLVRVILLALDPYLRGRMGSSAAHSSARPPVALGEVMEGGTLAEVVLSRHPEFAPGDLVTAPGGWQEYAVVQAGTARRVDPGLAPAAAALSILGMPGLTGYIAVRRIARPGPGETVVVAAATGTVGSVAAQLARADGARVVGIAGGPRKVGWLREAGFDVALDHRDPEFERLLAEATPDGVDVYVENVGGAVTTAVWQRLNRRARVAVCGVASAYNATEAVPDLNRDALMSEVVTRGLLVQGFAWVDFADLRGEFEREVAALVRTGRMTFHHEIVEGLEQAPEAFVGMLAGDHLGKRLVRIGADPADRTDSGQVSPASS